jgi:hypothetical protein
MTNEQHSEGHESVENREREAPLALDALPGQLGYVETSELIDLREDLIEAMTSGSGELGKLATEYNVLAEEVVDWCDDHKRPQAQIGLIIAMGLTHSRGQHVIGYVCLFEVHIPAPAKELMFIDKQIHEAHNYFIIGQIV